MMSVSPGSVDPRPPLFTQPRGSTETVLLTHDGGSTEIAVSSRNRLNDPVDPGRGSTGGSTG